MSKPKAQKKSKTARAAKAANTPAKSAPAAAGSPGVAVDPKEIQRKVNFLNKVLAKKPADDDSRLVQKLRAEMTAQKQIQTELQGLQQKTQQLQASLQAGNGRVNVVGDLLWDAESDAD